MPDEKPLFGSSLEPDGSGSRKLVLIGVGLAGVVAALAAYRFLSDKPDATPSPIASAASTTSSPHVPKDVPVPGVMRKVAGGTFQMGSEDGDPDEKPVHEAKVGPFELDETEVTVKAYAVCVAAGKCTTPDKNGYCNWDRADRLDHPVNCVDHQQATAYCAFVDKRLPREEEWEFAARGSDGRRFPWKGGDPVSQLCWNGEGSDVGKGKRQGTCPVASYPAGASADGVLDMAGNVWEWTAAPYCPYDKPDCGDPNWVIRGGGWNNLVPRFVRAQDRSKEGDKTRNDNIGFRCAKGGPA